MKTNFFATIAPILGSMNLTFTVAKDESGTIIVSVLPKPRINDNAKSNIQPMIIRGSIEELDESFFDAIKEPMADVTGIVIEIDNFEKGAKKLAEENKAAADIKAKAKKNKEKADKILVKAQAFFDEKEYDKAQKELDKAIELVPGTPAVNKLANALKDAQASDNQVDIFSAIEEVKEEPKIESKIHNPLTYDNYGPKEEKPKMYVPEQPAESPNELEKENNRIIHSSPMDDAQIEAVQEEMNQKFNQSNQFQYEPTND